MLDVTISSDLILRDILDITDLRSSKRIDFVGGIRGLGDSKRPPFEFPGRKWVARLLRPL